jgi:hypothetical protein
MFLRFHHITTAKKLPFHFSSVPFCTISFHFDLNTSISSQKVTWAFDCERWTHLLILSIKKVISWISKIEIMI